MRLQEAKESLALAFLESCRRAGFCGASEADDSLNDASRAVVEVCHLEHGQAWLGFVNEHKGEDRWVWPWEPGQTLYNFGADFVLPAPCEEVVLLLARYRAIPVGRCREWGEYLDRISLAIERCGGVLLCWS